MVILAVLTTHPTPCRREVQEREAELLERKTQEERDNKEREERERRDLEERNRLEEGNHVAYYIRYAFLRSLTSCSCILLTLF